MRRWLKCLAAVWVLQSAAVLAVEQHYALEDITVRARRRFAAEQNLSTINLESAGRPVVSTIPDALDKTAGIDVQRRSVLTPKDSQVRIRGFSEKRSLILLDGRPLNGTGVMGGQFVDWSSLSAAGWTDLELGKGAFSAKYGNTLGGTINLTSRVPEKTPEIRVHAGAKRYETYSLGASAAGRSRLFGARIAAERAQTEGHLRNSAADRDHFDADLYYFWGDDGKVRAGIRYAGGEFEMPVGNDPGLPGFRPEFPQSTGSYLIGPGIQFPGTDRHGDGSYYDKERTELDLSIEKTFWGVDTEIKLYSNREDREDHIYSYDLNAVVLERECTPDRSRGWAARAGRDIGRHRLGLGADGNYQGYDGTENTYIKAGYFKRAPSDGQDERDATRWQGVYLDDQWRVTDALDLYAGLRYDDYRGDRTADRVTGYAGGKPAGFETIDVTFDEGVLQPKFGAVYRPYERVSLFARFARAVRFPDNPAFYWYHGGYRPEVDPGSNVVRKPLTYEDALQYEAGITCYPREDLMVSLSYYQYQVDDYIRWIFGYAPSRVVYNIDSVDFQGVEMDAQGRLWGDVSAFANFTWQKTQKHGDTLDGSNAMSDELSELPDFKVNVGVEYAPPEGFSAKAALRWVDAREVPYLGTPGAPFAGSGSPEGAPLGSGVTLQKMDDFAVVDFQIGWLLIKEHWRANLTAGVENLFDADYEEELDFPAPGRSFHIGAEILF